MTVADPRSAVVTGPLPALDDPGLTVPERLRVRAVDHPDRTAVIDGVTAETWTYHTLVERIDEVAAGLALRGVEPGDTVAVYAPNSPAWVITALAAMECGAAVTGISPGYGPEEVSRQIRASKASIVITTRVGLDALSADVVGRLRTVVTIDGAGPGSLEDLATAVVGPARREVSADACCALPFSSGTSGQPKGVVVTHRSVGAVIDQVGSALPTEGEVILAFLPMFHIFGFSVVTLAGLCGGATLVTLPAFDPPQFLTALSTHRVTQLFVVPPVMGFLAGHPAVDQFDLSSLRLVGCGAAPLPTSIEAGVAARLGCTVAQGFGMTESSGIISLPSLDSTRPGSCGQLVAGTESRIVDPATGEDVVPGAAGELWFRGPQAATGYLDEPEATAETFRSDGWVRTGDIARFDDDGHLYITDRLKELIKVKGYQVAPAELESVLLSHPSVSDVAVVGVSHPTNGEVPVAFVVGDDVDRDEIRAWMADRVVDYKVVAAVIVTDDIPKNPSGKILRRVLRDRLPGGGETNGPEASR